MNTGTKKAGPFPTFAAFFRRVRVTTIKQKIIVLCAALLAASLLTWTVTQHAACSGGSYPAVWIAPFLCFLLYGVSVAAPKRSVFWFYEWLLCLLFPAGMCALALSFRQRWENQTIPWFETAGWYGKCMLLTVFFCAAQLLLHRSGTRNTDNPEKNRPAEKLLLFFSPHVYRNAPKPKRSFRIGGLGNTVLMLLALIILTISWYIRKFFPEMDLGTVMYTLRNAHDTGSKQILLFILRVGLVIVLLALLFYRFYASRRNERGIVQTIKSPDGSVSRRYRITRKQMLLTTWLGAGLLLVIALCSIMRTLEVPVYAHRLMNKSQIYENYYAPPESVRLTFPEHKKNLVYIYLESYENTYTSYEFGGDQPADYMPELRELAKNNVSFSHTNGLGGPSVFFSDILYTMGSSIAQTSGISMNCILNTVHEKQNGNKLVIPNAVKLEDILHDAGYTQRFLLGSNSEFAKYNRYVGRYENSTIYDYKTAKARGDIPQDYHEMWGFEDRKLFEFAKQQLAELASGDAPFCLTMYTMDTHSHEYGYHCPLCDPEINDQFLAAVRCSSRQVADFVEWLKEQPYYEDTVIILIGDHLASANIPKVIRDDGFTRTTYNCIINSPKTPVNTKFRTFCSMDMFPTALSAIGVEIEGSRLGLGTDLFSDTPTVCEVMGRQAFLDEIQLWSDYYYRNF
ncbi:MAG: LTA synthase family protein [Oscillospiraceae bacterium]|nr:LTA synthase family protein [Oscillospiraceae bacterium]